MARIDTFGHFLTDVATAIRNKTGKSETIACEDFDTEIGSISTYEPYRLPSQYQEVEYIGITEGNGYIDTEFIPTYYSKAVVRGLMTSGTFLLGEDTSWANKGFGILARYSYFSNKWSSVSMSLNVLYDFTVSKDGYYWGTSLKDSFSGASTFTAEYSLYVFANHRNGSPDEYGKGKIYSLDLYEDGVLRKQFIPCYEKSTNIIGLYDLVGEKFHRNQGSGTWIKGENHDVPKENLQTKSVTITENSTTNVEPDTGYDGLSSVSVTTNVLPNLQTKSVTITSNTTTNIAPDTGYDGIGSVAVTTNVASGGQKNRLPDEYQEVEYIQSSGTQYFVTDYYANGNSQYKFKFSEGSTNGVVFGAYNSAWTTGSGFYHNATTNEYEYVHYYSNAYLSSLRGSYLNVYDIYIDKGNVYSNGVLIQSGSTKTFTLNYPTYILAGNWAGSRAEQPLSCKLYYFQIFVDGIKLHDYIPCYRKADSVIGMYDLVEDEFITNAGTGTFEKGPDHDTPIANLQDKEITITENTTTEITADSDYDGLGTVSVITNVASSSTPIFSTTEVEVGTWIDNKPLYMKTVTETITTSASGSFDVSFDHNITNVGIMFMGNNSFIAPTNNLSQSYPINYTNTTSNTYSQMIRTNIATNGKVRTLSGGSILPNSTEIICVVNVFYTKTTDSVLANVSAVNGNNYSETEHIVGTTPDNETVYEKTVVKSGGHYYGKPFNQTFAHNISNVNKIWISDGSFIYGDMQAVNNRQFLPANYINNNADKQRQFQRTTADNTNISIYVGDYMYGNGTLHTYTTLRYTKNTV